VPSIEQQLASFCLIPRPKHVRTEATTAYVSLTDSTQFEFDLTDIKQISVAARIVGEVNLVAQARVKWGQAIPFFGSCKTIGSDSGTIEVSLPFILNATADLDLDLDYDPERVALVVDKHASLDAQVNFYSGDIDPDFGDLSITDVLIELFEGTMLDELESAARDELRRSVAALNFRLDGKNTLGQIDPNIEAFNQPTTFLLEQDEDDLPLVRSLLDELGLPDLVIHLVENRGIEILGELAALNEDSRRQYLGELGAGLACDAILSKYQTPMANKPLYQAIGGQCRVGQLGQNGSFFSDHECNDPVAFEPTDLDAYCTSRASQQAGELLGNAAAWDHQPDQINNPLPDVRSLPWTLQPGPTLDLGVASLRGSHQPFSKQLEYKRVENTERGNGQCALEMRVYKKDLSATNLKPLMAIHGGTWQHRGFSFLGLESTVARFTEDDYIVFVPFYRLVGDSDGNEECNGVTWKEVVADVEDALSWIEQNGIRLGAQSMPVTLFGQSAGAHLAAWLSSYRSDSVERALLMYPPLDTIDFLNGALPEDGPYSAFRGFGLRSLVRFFGANRGLASVDLRQLDPQLKKSAVLADPNANIPDQVFNENLAALEPFARPCLDVDGEAELACLKQELAEFLARNSFFDELDQVPVFVLHGTADDLVPYQQAVELCSARSGASSSGVGSSPLTQLGCGADSLANIIMDAEHALDLGPCIGPLCPAGNAIDPSRGAVDLALSDAYAWLGLSRPQPAPSTKLLPLKNASESDATDIALLLDGERIQVAFWDAQSGMSQGLWSPLPEGWILTASEALTEKRVGLLTHKDGVHRFVVGSIGQNTLFNQYPMGTGWISTDVVSLSGERTAFLATRISDDLPVIEIKTLQGDQRQRLLYPFNKQWLVKNITVVENNGQTQLAALATHREHRHAAVQVFDVDEGTNLGMIFPVAGQWRAKKIAALTSNRLAVTLFNNESGMDIIQVFDVGSRDLIQNIYPIGSGSGQWIMHTLSDLDGDLAIASTLRDSGSVLVQAKNSNTGQVLRNHWFIPTPWYYQQGFGVLGDINGNGASDLAILLEDHDSGDRMIQIRDGLSNTVLNNLRLSP
ncbi:MAG: alpha/beta hydrolase, partial [Pseudomonadota bacterium]